MFDLESVFDVASEAMEIAKGKRLISKEKGGKNMAAIKEDGIEPGYGLKALKSGDNVRLEIHELIGLTTITVSKESWLRIVKAMK